MNTETSQRTLVLETAQGVRFPLLLAGPIARSIALTIDTACVGALVLTLSRVSSFVGLLNADVGSALSLISYFVVATGYSIVCEWRLRGQTLGKRLLNLRVVDATGLKLALPQVVVRNLLRVVDMLPVFYAVGGISCLVTRHCQRLGDLAANTAVICAEPSALGDWVTLADSHYNSIREQPRLVARLRQVLTPEQARVLLFSVLRRETLEPAARVALFAELASDLKGKIRLGSESLIGLSDERFVLDVVESLFNTEASSPERKPAQEPPTN